MIKKTVLFCLFCAILFCFTACQISLNEAEDKESYEYIFDFFVPEGAEVVSHVDDFLALNSTLPFPELIAFYKNAFQTLLDVHETEIDDTQDGVWIFSGLYHGFHIHQRASGLDRADNRERPFIVVLRDNGLSVDIEIVY